MLIWGLISKDGCPWTPGDLAQCGPSTSICSSAPQLLTASWGSPGLESWRPVERVSPAEAIASPALWRGPGCAVRFVHNSLSCETED